MIIILIVTGIISLIFGLILILTPKFLAKISVLFDRIVFKLDEKLESYKFSLGVILVMVAIWMIYMSFRYPSMARLMQVFWITALVFGLLYMFFPKWLSILSDVSDREVFVINGYIRGYSKVIGIILVFASIYMFCTAFSLAVR